MKTKELIRLLERNGFTIVRAQKHYVLKKGDVMVCVPRHTEVNLFLSKKIIKTANIAA